MGLLLQAIAILGSELKNLRSSELQPKISHSYKKKKCIAKPVSFVERKALLKQIQVRYFTFEN